MSKPVAFRTVACTTRHARRSRARMYRGECAGCTGLIALLYRDARGPVRLLRTAVRKAARKTRARLPTVYAEQLALF